MQVADLARQCADNINFYTTNKMPAEEAGVMLTTPKGWKPPPKFPRGKLCVVKEDGSRVWAFKAMRILAWLVANGLVKPIYEDRDDFAVDTTA
ncbi:hypothetical protein QA639_21035 [Bradyrhizobium pachyrhizi]|uniref:hypothetical protein n=1 Tax=Bradyrhizobium pachyrhizi TaxID=280333 RepID=UPI0024B1C9D7|nr:hypothetical protein [Bradyrhizobium pachyrhizi]WFU52195.1 hypothetical protein QA639_21035 [Bradyrhizobium pachyrhizi]